MADEAEVQETAPPEKKKSGMLVPIIGAVVASVVLSVGGTFAGLYFAGVFDQTANAAPADASGEGVEGGALPAGPEVGIGTEVVPLQKFHVNLKDGSGGRKISLDISLEGKSTDGKTTLAEAIGQKEAAIRDTINFLVMDFTYSELRGTDGMLRLRDEVHRRIIVQVEDMGVRVDRVYFTDVVVQ